MVRYCPEKGEAHIKSCVMIIVICMILSALLTFAYAVNLVRQTERNSRVVLDNYVMTDAIEIYNAIKQGRDTEESISSAKYSAALADFCTFVKEGNYYYNYGEDGKVQYYLSQPVLSFAKEKSLKIRVKYTVFIPVFFAGRHAGPAGVPVTVTARFSEKW